MFKSLFGLKIGMCCRWFAILAVYASAVAGWFEIVAAEEPHMARRAGAGLIAGNTVSPNGEITFFQATGFLMWDYDDIWWHDAPDGLWFKAEATAGGRVRPDSRLMASVGMTAMYYPRSWQTSALQPFIEGGIGVIYTDFQVDGQGLRFNFYPHIGVGTDFVMPHVPDITWFADLRLHHWSNAGFDDDNRGVNSLVLTIGRYF